MSMKPVRDEFVIAGDITLHYVQWGTQGPAIICTHDFMANALCFQAFADLLAPDYRVFAYDIRGRGDSDKLEEDYSISIYADDLAALIDELELDRPIVLGHSLGALVSLHYAAQYPTKLRKLILVDGGAPLPWHSFAEMPSRLKSAISHLDIPTASLKEYSDRLKNDLFLLQYSKYKEKPLSSLTPANSVNTVGAIPKTANGLALETNWNDYIEAYVQHDVLINNDGSVVGKIYPAALVEEAKRAHETHPEEQWAHVMVPTLLLRAGQGLLSDNDPFLSEDDAKLIQQGIRDCQYVNFPTLNHYALIFGIESGPGQAIRAFIDAG